MGLVSWAFRFSVKTAMVLIALVIFLTPLITKFVIWSIASIVELIVSIIDGISGR
ncbi:hypothetical protein ACTXLI_16495 [Glutamicibacter arilaitensis]